MPISRVRFRTDTTPDTNSGSTAAEPFGPSEELCEVSNGSNFEVNQNIKATITGGSGTEEMTISAINGNILTLIRGVNGTTGSNISSGATIFKDDSPTYTPTQNPNIGSDISKTYDGIKVKKSLGGETYTFANHESSRRQRKLIYENISESNKNRLVALHNYAKGQKNSFQYSEDGDTWYAVRFVNNKLPVSETAYNVYRVEINIEEQL